VLEGSAKKGNWKGLQGEEVDRNKCIRNKKSANLEHEYFQSCSYVLKLSHFFLILTLTRISRVIFPS
jgi:hypothetical protein